MKKLNLPPFYVGQKVVVNNDKSLFNKYNLNHTEYVKEGIIYMVTGNVFDNGWNLWYTYLKGVSSAVASEFLSPIEEQKFPLMTFEKIKETEKEEILILN